MGLNTFYYFLFNDSFACSIDVHIGHSTILGLLLEFVNGIISHLSLVLYIRGHNIQKEPEKRIHEYRFIL